MADSSRNDYLAAPRDGIGKAALSFPTPVNDDFVVVEEAPVAKGRWTKTFNGTPHPKYNGANGARLARLISETETQGDNNKTFVRQVYATDRQNQDLYNAAISYTAQSGAHRVLVRSSLLPRDADPDHGIAAYAPLPDLTTDSLIPTALCTQEQATPAEAPYDKLYLRVTRTFEDFGTRAQQDTWNRQDSFPYLLATAPRLTRVYRFPANYEPGFVIGTTTDSAVPAATLISVARQDESARVRVYTCVFDAIPAAASQTGLGYSVTFPYESRDWPLVTWRFRVANSAYAKATDYEACPIPGFSGLVLTSQALDPADDAAGVSIETRVYQRVPGPQIIKEEKTRVPRGLTVIPGPYLNGDDLTTTTQLVLPGTSLPALSNTVLQVSLEDRGLLTATLSTVTRADITLPTLHAPSLVSNADFALGDERRSVVDSATAVIPTGFHYWAGSLEPLSPTQSELRSLYIAVFPTLAGSEAGRPASPFPGEFGYGDGGGEVYVEKIVSTGGVLSGLPTGYVLLSRAPHDAYHDRVRYGIRDPESGTTEITGYLITGRGDLAMWDNLLGGAVTTSSWLTLESEMSPAGGGQVKSRTVTATSFGTEKGLEVRGANIPDILLSGVSVQTDQDKVNITSSLPTITAGFPVLSVEIRPDNRNRGNQATRKLPSGTSITNLYVAVDSESARDAGGEKVKTERKIVGRDDALPTVNYKTLTLGRKDVGNNLSEQTVRTLDADKFPKLTDWVDFQGGRYGVQIKEDHETIDADLVPDPPPKPSGGVSITYEATENKLRAVKITRTLRVPTVIPDENGEVARGRPNLLASIVDLGAYSDGSGRRRQYWNIQRGGPYVARTKTVITIANGLTPDAIAAELKGDDIIYYGEFVSVDQRNLLFDGSVTIYDGSNSITLTSVNGTKTGYLAAVGTPRVISSTVDDFAYGLQIRRTTSYYPQ